MPDSDRLKATLNKLGTPGESVGGGARRLRSGTIAQILAAMLREFDETILARKLTFVIDSGQTLSCDVYNRRLLRLVGPPPAGLPTALEPLFGHSLTGSEDEELVHLLEVFRHVLGNAKSVTVTSHPPSERVDATDLGPSAELLSQAWGVAMVSGRSERDRAERLASILNKSADAWIWLGEDGRRTGSGSGKTATRLSGLFEGHDAATGTAECRVFAIGGETLISANVGANKIVATLSPKAAAAFMGGWRALGL